MGPVPGVRGGFPGRPGGQGPRVGWARALPSHPPGCPSPKGPGPGVRRARGVLPGRPGGSGAPARVSGGCFPGPPGGQGPRVGPCPDGPPPGCPGEASQAVPGVRGPGSGPAPMGPVPGVRGGFPGRPGGQGPRVGRALPSSRLPFPEGPRPGCPAGPGSPPRPSRGVRGPGPGVRGMLPRPSRGSGAPGRALPRRAPSRVSGEASQAVPGVRGPGSGPAPKGPGPGVRGPGSGPAPMGPVPGGFPGRRGGQGPRVGPCPDGPRPRCPGPRVGPCPDGPRPWCPGRLPRPSRGSGAPGRALPRWAPAQVSGAPGRALPRWAPSRVSGEASQAVPGVRGPGSGPPLLQPALPRWAPGRAGPPSLPCPDGPRPVPRGPRRLRELRQSASRWPPSEPGHLASPRTRGIWSPSALICYGASRWPGCPGSPDEGSFAPSCPARAPGGRVRSRRRSPPSPGAHQLPGRAQIFLRITRDRVRRTPSWSGGPVVLDRAPRARVARPPPRTLVRRVSPPKLAAQRADCRPGSSQHRTPIDWAHLVRLGMDCLASLGCCFKQRASNPARDRPTRGPAVSRKALPGRAKAKQPGSLRPPSGPTRVERGRVAPGPGNPPPHGGPGTRVPSPASSSTQRIFPSSSERPFRGASPPVPAGRHPLRPPLRLRLGPAASTPRRRPVPAGSRATALSRAVRDGHAATPLSRIINGGAARATQGASPKALGCLPERNTPQAQGPALALAHPWLAERSAAAGAPGREDRARVRAPPARRTRPSRKGGTGEREGGARARLPGSGPSGSGKAEKSSPSRDGTHAHPARPWEGKPNRSATLGLDHPRKSCRPRAAGRPGRGGAGAREGTAAPPDQGRWVG
ncbi:hypothetical protein NDU88_006327 [Pleurodeles waltl]|uniref:Uncharacterized protein n=1 Tax=Pleurodeles waltl TaxID=8319 RepID=A0AAV7TEH8_PLEWA|nr:hypothetical protein NDU88_006327 [Pleurodeles waltl]